MKTKKLSLFFSIALIFSAFALSGFMLSKRSERYYAGYGYDGRAAYVEFFKVGKNQWDYKYEIYMDGKWKEEPFKNETHYKHFMSEQEVDDEKIKSKLLKFNLRQGFDIYIYYDIERITGDGIDQILKRLGYADSKTPWAVIVHVTEAGPVREFLHKYNSKREAKRECSAQADKSKRIKLGFSMICDSCQQPFYYSVVEKSRDNVYLTCPNCNFKIEFDKHEYEKLEKLGQG